MMPIKIRVAVDEDLAAAQCLSDAAFLELRAIYRPTADAMTVRKAAVSDAVRLVAELEGQLVGTVLYRVDADHVRLIALAVDSRYRRSGIARQLIEEAGRVAQSNGIGKLGLWTIRETGNVSIFARLGFRIVREGAATLYESDKFSELHDVYLEKPLYIAC